MVVFVYLFFRPEGYLESFERICMKFSPVLCVGHRKNT